MLELFVVCEDQDDLKKKDRERSLGPVCLVSFPQRLLLPDAPGLALTSFWTKNMACSY